MKKNIILLLLLSLSFILNSADRITGKMNATRSPVIAQEGMVASSHPLEQ